MKLITNDTVIHNFADSLEKSHRAEDLPFWEETYKKAFPDMVAMINHRKDGIHQRNGIDRSIILSNSKQLLIDEKVRGRNKKGKVYTDIALEYWSDMDRKVKGWVCKALLADYIAYAIAPLGICYLLPVIQLQNAWREYGEAWIKKYPDIRAENTYWTTQCVGVPREILYPAIGKFFKITFKPFEITDERR